MIEQAMIFTLGFLIAGLLALVIAPAFWRRALRLSTRRLEMLIPLSSREIIAERDLLRAEFAVDRRKFEQQAERLQAIRFADMAELGRRASEIVAKDAAFAALTARHADQAADLAGARDALADALAQFAATASALYSETGLVERKDADLMRLRGELARSTALAATQSAALADLEARLAREQADLRTAREDVASLSEALRSLHAEKEADQAALGTMAARLADSEAALEALQAAAHDKVAAAEARAEHLTQDLAALRRLNTALDLASPADLSPATIEREENAILRQTLNEIGAAIVRAAAHPVEAAQAQHPIRDSSERPADGASGEPKAAAAPKQRQIAKRV